MTEKLTRIHCTRSECLYFVRDEKSGVIYCRHPEKEFYTANKCPLFVLDWQKKLGAVEQLKERFSNNHNGTDKEGK